MERERSMSVILVPSQEFVTDLPSAPEGYRYETWSHFSEPGHGGIDPAEVTMAVCHSSVAKWLTAMRQMPNLRDVQTTSIGVDQAAPNTPPWATLHNAAGVHEGSTAEHALALTLAALRKIPQYVRAQDRQEWPGNVVGPADTLGTSIVCKTVLIVGYGGVGREIGNRLAGFGCVVEAVGTRRRIEQGITVYPRESLPTLLPRADVVILALPLTDQTRGIADSGFFGGMKDGALLVNVGRGALVCNDALADAARGGRVLAALDVVDPEPLPADSPLWALPGVLITPHVGALTDRMWPNEIALIGAQIQRHARREPLVNTIALDPDKAVA